MKFTAITCPQCGYEQSIGVPEKGVKALHKCDHCKVVLRSPNNEVNCIICAYGNEDCPGRPLGHPSHQSVRWNRVTWYSKIIAVILFVLVYMVGFWLGTEYQITANEILSMQEETRTIARSASQNKINSRVLGVSVNQKQAVYWVDTSKPNPFIDECSGAVVPKYLDANYSLNDLLLLQLSQNDSIDRLTGFTNPLAKTDIALVNINTTDNPYFIDLSGSIDDLSFCEQIQTISQLQALIKQEKLDTPVEVTLNDSALFIVPAGPNN